MTGIWSALADGSFALGYRQAGPIRTRYLEAGEGPPLVFLHGVGGHLETYTRNILPHAEHFHVIALDMLGHGYTDKPDRSYEIADYVQHLLDFCDALGLERVHLSGESLGGWVAAKFAVDHPNRVDKLVLNTAGGLTADPAVMERLKSLSMRAVEQASPQTVRTRLEFLMKEPATVTDDLVETRLQIYQQPGFGRTMAHIMCLQEMERRQRNLLREEELRRIGAPTLVVWTTHDPTAPVSVGQRFADLIPHAELVVMDDCGHWPQFEDAARFNALHLEFLRRGESSP